MSSHAYWPDGLGHVRRGGQEVHAFLESSLKLPTPRRQLIRQTHTLKGPMDNKLIDIVLRQHIRVITIPNRDCFLSFELKPKVVFTVDVAWRHRRRGRDKNESRGFNDL